MQKSEAGGAASPELLRNGFTGKASESGITSQHDLTLERGAPPA